MKPIVIFFMCIWAHSAFAQSLFNENVCPVVEASEQPQFYSASYSTGVFSCQELKLLAQAPTYIGISLLSAKVAMAGSSSLSAELAASAAVFVNPAVLSVAVVGTVGISVVYIVMNKSLEECEQQDRAELRQSIMNELESKYGLQPSQSQVPLEMGN